MATIHGTIRKDKLLAGYNGNLESVKHSADLDNGHVFFLGGLSAGEREIKDVVVPATGTIASERLYVNGTGELTYLAGQTKTDFYVPAGKPALAYPLERGDIITISDNVISGSTVVGQFVIPQNASLQLKADAAGTGTRFVGKVIEKTTIYGQAASVIQVVAN